MKILAPIDELKDIISKEYADGKFLSALSVNGDNLQYTINGVNKLLTVPYASKAATADVATYATNARITNTQPTAGTTYYPAFVSGIAANTNYPLRGNDTVAYRLLEGTASAEGMVGLWLGNNIASGTAGNAYGYLRLYGTNTGNTVLRAKSQTGNYTQYLPAANGTLVYHTTGSAIGNGSLPVYVDSAGKVTACSNLLGVRTTVFAHSAEAASSSAAPASKFEGALYTSGMYATANYADANTPKSYGNIINLMGSGGGQIFASWEGSYKTGSLYYRSHRDNTLSGGWTPWVTILDSQNYASVLDSSYVKKNGDTMTGKLSLPTLAITDTGASAHIQFSRASYNYINAPASGIIAIMPNNGGQSSTAGYYFDGTKFYAGTTNSKALGGSSYRWSNVYSVLGNFSGQITSSVATGTAPFVVASTTEVANLHSATASKLHTARTIALSGAVTGTATSFDGSGNITIPTTSVNASNVTGIMGSSSVYYGHHPEGFQGVMPFLYNDLAHLTQQGGSCTIYTTTDTDYTKPTLTNTGTIASNPSQLFDCAPNYLAYTVASTSTVIVIDITCPTVYAHTTKFYIDFGSSNWLAKDVSVYVWNNDSKNTSQVYTQKLSRVNVVSVVSMSFFGSFSYSYSNGTSTVQGFNRLRIVLTNFVNLSPRIAQVGLVNYSSLGARMGYVSRGINDVLYRNFTPAKDATYSLGTSAAKWKSVYASNFYGNIKFTTPRTLWGQSFDGSANVSGNLTSVGNITGSGQVLISSTGASNAIALRQNNTDATSVILNSTAFKPYDSATGKLNLGTSSARWLGIYGNQLNINDSILYKKDGALVASVNGLSNNTVKASVMQVDTAGVADDIDWAFGVISQGGTSVNTANSGVGIILGGYANGADASTIGRGAGIAAVTETSWYNSTGIAFYVNSNASSELNSYTEKMRLTCNGNLIPKYSTTAQSLGSSSARWIGYFNAVSAAGHITPSVNSTYYLGTTALRWHTGYFNAAINIGAANSAVASGSSNTTIQPGMMEMSGGTPSIDFHYANSTADYTNRIIEGLSGQLTITGALRLGLSYTTSTTYKFYVNGTSYLGGATNVNGHLTPSTSATYTLGSSSARWSYIYAAGIRRYDGTTASAVPLVHGESNNTDIVLLRASYATAETYTQSASYGFTLKYFGTGGSNVNYLKLLADNQTATSQVIALCVDQAGSVGVGCDNNAEYRLKVNGTAYISSALSVGGGVSISGTNSLSFSTYGGGINMADTSWIRFTGGKNVYHPSGTFRTDGYLVTNGGLTVGATGANNGTYKLHVTGSAYISSNLLTGGGITMYSAKVLKNIVDERGLSLKELSVIKPTRYTWKDGRDNRLHIGGIADDIQAVLPEVVYKTNEGVLTMDYANAAFAIASSLIKPVISHEERIARLERENRELKEEVKRLKSA